MGRRRLIRYPSGVRSIRLPTPLALVAALTLCAACATDDCPPPAGEPGDVRRLGTYSGYEVHREALTGGICVQGTGATRGAPEEMDAQLGATGSGYGIACGGDEQLGITLHTDDWRSVDTLAREVGEFFAARGRGDQALLGVSVFCAAAQ